MTPNPRLIDAAPDLLDASKRLLAVFDEQKQIVQRIIVGGRSDNELRAAGNEALNDLRAAIAKAEPAP